MADIPSLIQKPHKGKTYAKLTKAPHKQKPKAQHTKT